MELVEAFENALISLDRVAARAIYDRSKDMPAPMQFIETVITPALEKIGLGWENGTYALSQVYMGGRICEEIVNNILPAGSPGRRPGPGIAIALLEDYHMLGKRIVCAALRAGGFDVLDYGRIDVDSLINDNIRILLISVLMLPSALRVKDVKIKLNSHGYKTKIIVGGAPFRFDERLWQEVGADAMGRAASDAVNIVDTMIKGLP